MNTPQQAELFAAESAEYLAAIDRSVEEWESNPASFRVGEELLRALHNLKALASAMGYVQVTKLAHALEDLLGRLKERGHAPDEGVLQLLIRASHALRRAVSTPAGDRSHRELGDTIAEVQRAAIRAESGAHRSAERGWWVTVRLSPDAVMPGARAMVVLKRAGELGKVVQVDPPASTFSRDDFPREFSFCLVGSAGAEAVEAALRGAGEVERVELSAAPASPQVREMRESFQVRVEAGRIENLARLVEELRGELRELARLGAGGDHPELSALARRAAERLGSLEAEVRALRVTAVWKLFDRFPRIVRHLSRSLGKQVELVVKGRELEVDRGVLERLADPVLHLIRNAVDHGIESPGERIKVGKPAAGRLVLEAERSGSRLLVRVSDDGRGIDRERVLARGRAMGLLESSVRELSDGELLRLLSHPGFSTAGSPTDVSGRGIGLDVVASRVAEMGGTLRLETEPGRGSVFELDLPGAFHE
jgi:two-component system chemotaxis sensor kinase CheA